MSDDISQFIAFSKPFIDAAKNIFKTMVSTELETGKPTIKEGLVSKGDISSIIGMTGTCERRGETSEFKGQLVISFPKKTFLKVASAMLYENFTELNEDNSDTGAEIINMIMGNAKRDLTPLGYKMGMATPTTVSGAAHEIKYINGVRIIVIPMKCTHGDFFVEICYQELF
jgi:chemotaxis protein CheX